MTKQIKFFYTILCFGIILWHSNINAQSNESIQYSRYIQPLLDKPEIKPNDIAAIIKELQSKSLFTIKEIGRSYEDRSIHRISIGQGKTHILLWSQMHGDEPTATASIFDVLNYISADENASWRNAWLSKLTLHFVPMLNPDGSERATRFNAQGIDVNRDASKLQTPEGQLLHQLVANIKPDFGFNLHDQSRAYAVGDTDKAATISVLAPSFNKSKDVNKVRLQAMQVIAQIVTALEPKLTGHVARYNDDYSHRAFGDTLTRLGVSTVLIESGGFSADDNRQVARKATFSMILAGIDAIHSQSYLQYSQRDYDHIPMNTEGKVKDLLIKNITINAAAKPSYSADLIIDLGLYGQKKAKLTEIGDASIYTSYHQFDAINYQYKPGQAYNLDKEKSIRLTDKVYLALLKSGVSHFVGDATKLHSSTMLPVVINPDKAATATPSLKQSATFLLSDRQGVKFAVLNGQVLDLATKQLLNPLGT